MTRTPNPSATAIVIAAGAFAWGVSCGARRSSLRLGLLPLLPLR